MEAGCLTVWIKRVKKGEGIGNRTNGVDRRIGDRVY